MEKYENVVSSLSGDREEDEKTLEPFHYIFRIPGKNIRNKLGRALNQWFNIPEDKLEIILEMTQIIHTCTLLLDDIEDDADLRRGIPVAHKVYGLAHTINAANYAAFIALEKVFALDHSEALKIYTHCTLELFRGQGIEMYWRTHSICPSEAAYKKMTIQKTGALFKLIVLLMQKFSNWKENITSLVENFGLYFQIRDDYCSLYLREYAEKKSYCEDLTEGKFSFPIIHAIRSHPEDTRVINILKQRTRDHDVKQYCIKILEKYGSFAYTRTVLEELDLKIRDEIQRLKGNPVLLQFLDQLMNWKDESA
ncbi:terpene synthase-like [Ptiloglossa arizonensis]|uniref:terpene synthase-like n=1 Tax=Ptiloglossa arizonensis TaxID=3350558 RepID=UPI003F9F01B4